MKASTTHKAAADLLISEGHTVTSIDGRQITWVCKNNHRRQQSSYDILRGHRCPFCSRIGKQPRKPVVAVAGDRQGNLEVVEYLGVVDDHSSVLVRNVDNGNRGVMTVHAFRTGQNKLWTQAELSAISASNCRRGAIKRRGVSNAALTKFRWSDIASKCEAVGMAFMFPFVDGPIQLVRGHIWTTRCSCGVLFKPELNALAFCNTRSCGCVKSRQQRVINEWVCSQGLVTEWNDHQQIAPLELDIWIPEKKVAIEYCGLYWHGEELLGAEAQDKHAAKFRACQAAGIRLITIFEDEWLTKKEAVLGFLASILGLPAKRVGARELCVETLAKPAARAFLAVNHLQGVGGGSEYLGLVDSEKHILAVMSFGKPNASRARKSVPGVFELIRYCVLPGISIPGGPEKLLNAWKLDHPEAVKLISYSDNRWSAGNLYRRLGFIKKSDGVPSYWYFPAHTQGPRKHRYAWCKSVAVKTFNADPALTEWQIVSANGWDRIWDCGSATWELAL